MLLGSRHAVLVELNFPMRCRAWIQQRGVQRADVQKSCHMVHGDPNISPSTAQSPISVGVNQVHSRFELPAVLLHMGLNPPIRRAS